jgi:hypothetical protein
LLITQTLVGLGADLSEVVTRSSLQSGIAYAISQHRLVLDAKAPDILYERFN